MKHKVTKLLKDPVGVAKRRISSLFLSYKYRAPNGYRADMYWTDRRSKYEFDLRGVGRVDLSENENQEIYARAKETFLYVCRQQGIIFKNVCMVEIGCGTGFYARTFLEDGGTEYLGIDITDVLFPKL